MKFITTKFKVFSQLSFLPLLILVFCWIIVSGSSSASEIKSLDRGLFQVNRLTDTISYTNKIGFSASMMSFYGVNYQRYLTPDLRLSLNGMVYLSSDSNPYSTYESDRQKDLMYAIGTSLHKIVINEGLFNIYFIGSVAYFNDKDERTSGVVGSDNYSQYIDRRNITNFGLGLGAGYQLAKYIAVDVEFGYMYSYSKTRTSDYNRQNLPNEPNYEREVNTSSESSSILPSVGIGFYLCL